MKYTTRSLLVVAMLSAAFGAAQTAQAGGHRPKCHRVDADLVEDFATEGCKPGEASCYLGQIEGRGLHGTTHFKGDSSAPGPATSPNFAIYSGLFEYTTARGTILTRETGVVNTSRGNPESGAVTAFQQIIDATGAYAGASGHFFVSGFNVNGHVVTEVTGNYCLP